jgi:hypothetical protein
MAAARRHRDLRLIQRTDAVRLLCEVEVRDRARRAVRDVGRLCGDRIDALLVRPDVVLLGGAVLKHRRGRLGLGEHLPEPEGHLRGIPAARRRRGRRREIGPVGAGLRGRAVVAAGGKLGDRAVGEPAGGRCRSRREECERRGGRTGKRNTKEGRHGVVGPQGRRNRRDARGLLGGVRGAASGTPGRADPARGILARLPRADPSRSSEFTRGRGRFERFR